MIQEKLQGTTWSLVSYQSEDKHGEVIYPLGEDAQGYIVFTPDNYTSVHIMKRNRGDKTSSEELERFNTTAEKDMASLGYHAYTGPFRINEKDETLTTSVEVSLLPAYVGSDQTRKISLLNDQLHLSNVKHPERKLVWERVREQS